jgi:FlaA1/EpsC-like NDP-sugar epimerase
MKTELNDLFTLKDKVIVITGAAGLLGKNMLKQLLLTAEFQYCWIFFKKK